MFLFTTFLVISMASVATACSCIQISPKDQFCRVPYGFLGTVDSLISENNMTKTFKIKTIRPFVRKPSNATYQDPAEVKVSTAENSAACGLEFTIGQTVALAGLIEDGGMEAYLCGFHMFLKSNDPAEIRKVRATLNGYQKSCKSSDLS